MKVRARSFSSLMSALFLTVVLIGAVTAQGTSPNGSFGFLLNVSYNDPSNQGGVAILGAMNFDGAGNVSGPYTLELGSGGAVPVTTITGNFTGTYSGNPDGTGNITVALDIGVNLTFAMVIDDGGRGLQLVVTSCSGGCNLSGVVISGVGRAKRPKIKSVGVLQGSYGVQFTKSPLPATGLDVATFDGAGNVTVSTTFVGTGGQVSNGVFIGTYSVNPDGTGNITLAPQPGQGAQTFVIVITDGSSGLLLLQTNRLGNGVLYGTGRLQ
ncbi:MAG TPA: hypothetical protein VGR73_01770 [Bryobacteraceae bacterium]|nr:hypothetical protein [Bryobacteraceae bacterium]